MCDCDCELPKRERWQLIKDEHAHEFAEKIREDALLIEDEDDCCRKYGLALARSIEPQKEGQ